MSYIEKVTSFFTLASRIEPGAPREDISQATQMYVDYNTEQISNPEYITESTEEHNSTEDHNSSASNTDSEQNNTIQTRLHTCKPYEFGTILYNISDNI